MSDWGITEAQRADVVSRLASGICSLSFAKKVEVPIDIAYKKAEEFEKKACTSAAVAARTTTGTRPYAETLKNYTRKLTELLLDYIKNGDSVHQQGEAVIGTIDLFGSRDFLTKESTEEVLAPMFAEGAKIDKVRFSTKSFGRDAAEVASRAIEKCKHTLKDADISDVIAGRPEDEVLDALRTLSRALAGCQLRVLNLSDNALGEKGVRACAEVLTAQTALESLSLQNVGCSVAACAAVEELVKHSNLRRLHLFNNMSDNAGAAHIAKLLARCSGISDFKMASSRVGPEGGLALAHALAQGGSLDRLDLSDNPLTTVAAAPLAQLAAGHPLLKALNLNDTAIEEDGVLQVCQVLASPRCDCRLTELGLALNEATRRAAAAIGLALLHHRATLKKVNLRENELGSKGALLLAHAVAKLHELEHLDLAGNQIGTEGALAIARAAVALPKLQLLDLDENCISDDGIEEIKSIFEAAGKGAALGSFENNWENDEEEEEEEEEEEVADELASLLGKATI